MAKDYLNVIERALMMGISDNINSLTESGEDIHVFGEFPEVETWIPVYPGANWHEREVMEMFGISFTNHPNLVNLYLPTEFEGHPLRKDFPLLSRRAKPWPGIVDVELMPGEDDDKSEEIGEDT